MKWLLRRVEEGRDDGHSLNKALVAGGREKGSDVGGVWGMEVTIGALAMACDGQHGAKDDP